MTLEPETLTAAALLLLAVGFMLGLFFDRWNAYRKPFDVPDDDSYSFAEDGVLVNSRGFDKDGNNLSDRTRMRELGMYP